jgi:hypothetical protein
MESCNPISTPMELGIKLTKDDCPHSEEEIAQIKNHPYKTLVGSISYISLNTRPDISFATSIVAQYLANPGLRHWIAGKRILYYLKGTLDLGLLYKRTNQPLLLRGFSYANWAGSLDNRHSTSVYCFLLGKNIVSWASRKQRSVALSSIESEYMSLSKASIEAIWLRCLLNNIGCPQLQPTNIYVDNQSAIQLSKNPRFHDRRKHIDIQVHFICEQIQAQEVKLTYCHTSAMAADIFTKSLPKAKHHNCISLMGLDYDRLETI